MKRVMKRVILILGVASLFVSVISFVFFLESMSYDAAYEDYVHKNAITLASVFLRGDVERGLLTKNEADKADRELHEYCFEHGIRLGELGLTEEKIQREKQAGFEARYHQTQPR
jgi:hypothetical protein